MRDLAAEAYVQLDDDVVPRIITGGLLRQELVSFSVTTLKFVFFYSISNETKPKHF